MSNIKIGTKARQHVRELLANYNEMQLEINMIRESIINPHRQIDENIGGGRSSLALFEVEEKAIKLATHEQIAFRAKAVAIIDDVLAHSSDEAQKIIELKYFGHEPHSWVSIASQVEGYSEDGCRKVERKVVDRIGQRIGW